MFVAGFIGSPQMNFMNVTVEKDGDGQVLVFGDSRVAVNKPELNEYIGKEVVMGIRPEDIHADASTLVGAPAEFKAFINHMEMMGSENYLYLSAYGQKVLARIPARYEFNRNAAAKLIVDTGKIHVFDKETEKVICH
jgi:multiple sugar transport system ATP-binding protein